MTLSLSSGRYLRAVHAERLGRGRSHDWIAGGDGKRCAGGVKSRVKIIGDETTQSVRELSSIRGEWLTIAKTCPNSGIREIRW